MGMLLGVSQQLEGVCHIVAADAIHENPLPMPPADLQDSLALLQRH